MRIIVEELGQFFLSVIASIPFIGFVVELLNTVTSF